MLQETFYNFFLKYGLRIISYWNFFFFWGIILLYLGLHIRQDACSINYLWAAGGCQDLTQWGEWGSDPDKGIGHLPGDGGGTLAAVGLWIASCGLAGQATMAPWSGVGSWAVWGSPGSGQDHQGLWVHWGAGISKRTFSLLTVLTEM